ncbi:endonuclease/exonuclease/phosphatase family protein [Olivibacter sp. XZL3]|uniref:endonuclease/exonuclease/phosphatase family protein n=1 Tax=Olivibacter sp. XZL3 TaxID=1735116 RepID=UPI001067044E|nr:endonuclease/exonuclease/phosphatase family protein [Olivibacter sp. XZL3]
MKLLNILLLQIAFVLIGFQSRAQQIRLATYNIRYDNPGDSLDNWKHRKDQLFNLVRFYDFDLFGVQEALVNQMNDLSAALPAFAYVGKGRDDGDKKGEFSAIFYKKDRFKLLDDGMFWLSATDQDNPNVGWDAALPRICTWAKFEDKQTHLVFYHFNTHFDHRGKEARKESAKLVLRKIKTIAGNLPAVLTGDLNVDQHNESYQVIAESGILGDSYQLAKIKLSDNATFNGFRPTLIDRDSRIDHIFISKDFVAERYGILTNSSLGRYPSDHFPVMVDLEIK